MVSKERYKIYLRAKNGVNYEWLRKCETLQEAKRSKEQIEKYMSKRLLAVAHCTEGALAIRMIEEVIIEKFKGEKYKEPSKQISKKTKLELAICHILQTKEWLCQEGLFVQSGLWVGSPIGNKWVKDIYCLFDTKNHVCGQMIADTDKILLTEDELLTYYKQVFQENLTKTKLTAVERHALGDFKNV